MDTAVAWEASWPGMVEITGTMIACSTSTTYDSWKGPEGDDGIQFSILKDQKALAGPVKVLHGSASNQTGTLSAKAVVKKGDRIVFYQARGNWQDADAAYYFFVVHYN